MRVKYYWTEDGECELCERKDITLKEPAECYHCTGEIPAGACVQLTAPDGAVYLLHPDCARRGIG